MYINNDELNWMIISAKQADYKYHAEQAADCNKIHNYAIDALCTAVLA